MNGLRFCKLTLARLCLPGPLRQAGALVAGRRGTPDRFDDTLGQLQDGVGTRFNPEKPRECRNLLAERELVPFHLVDAVEKGSTLLNGRGKLSDRGEHLAHCADRRGLGSLAEPASTAFRRPRLCPALLVRCGTLRGAFPRNNISATLVELDLETAQFGFPIERGLGHPEHGIKARVRSRREIRTRHRGRKPFGGGRRITLSSSNVPFGAL
ncbi:hypothetical protein ACFSKM_02215 [Ancylobacter dichloromethanicus]